MIQYNLVKQDTMGEATYSMIYQDDDLLRYDYQPREEQTRRTNDDINEWGKDTPQDIFADNTYGYSDVDEQTKKQPLKKIANILILGVLIATILYYATPYITGGNKEATNIDQNNAESLITKMYTIKDVDTLITKNDDILTYFEGNQDTSIDVRDSEIYKVRYAEFSNTNISVEIHNTLTDNEGNVIIDYTVANQVDLPSNRIAKIKFNEDHKIESFNEQRMFPVMDIGNY